MLAFGCRLKTKILKLTKDLINLTIISVSDFQKVPLEIRTLYYKMLSLYPITRQDFQDILFLSFDWCNYLVIKYV